MPACASQTTDFRTDLSRVLTNATLYHGNASAYDWVVNTGSIVPTTDGARLTLNQTNGGTVISSTRYVHYGTIDFILETSKWDGVVTAAITMSDVKDEIDWEWPGANATSDPQTNFWFMGIANCTSKASRSIAVDVVLIGQTRQRRVLQFRSMATLLASSTLSLYVHHDVQVPWPKERPSLTTQFDWQEDYLNWLIDGNVVRSVSKTDTLSADGTQ
jgi:beta-glucanase (GH16 family)